MNALPSRPILLTLVALILSGHAADGGSIPGPTQIGNAASETADRISTLGLPHVIESDQSFAELVAVEVVNADDESLYGVRIDLKNAQNGETLYLSTGHAAQLHEELISVSRYLEHGRHCEARFRCVHGVSRCRPSQAEVQAVCPALFTTPDGKHGLIISTPANTFEFPYLEPPTFVDAIVAVSGNLPESSRAESAQDGIDK